jgi:hypothetical protein
MVHALTFNHTSPDLYNLFGTVGKDCATVYDDEHMGDHVGLVVNFQNAASEYTEGGVSVWEGACFCGVIGWHNWLPGLRGPVGGCRCFCCCGPCGEFFLAVLSRLLRRSKSSVGVAVFCDSVFPESSMQAVPGSLPLDLLYLLLQLYMHIQI